MAEGQAGAGAGIIPPLIFPLSSSLSGDGFYHNDDLTKRPPAAKYRPDQFRGYNTGSTTQLGWVHKEGNTPRD